MNKSTLTAAVLLSLGSAGLAHTTQAADLTNGMVLTITDGVQQYDAYGNFVNVSSGSWFSMDTDGNSKIAGTEKTTLATGVQGLVIGTAQNAGGYTTHSGAPSTVLGDSSNINAPWGFFGNTGKNYTTVAVTGGTTAGLDLSGWTVTWSGISAIDMGKNAWTPLNAAGAGMQAGTYTTGIAKLTWNGVNGSSYILDYTATVPLGDPSGFGGVRYALHLEGTVTAGPAATLVGDLGPSGLIPDISSSKTTSGCSLTSGTISASERGDWWLVLAFVGWLGMIMRCRQNRV